MQRINIEIKMRIFVQARHQYPAAIGGPGGGRVFDVLVKGLAELGHQVLYYLENKSPLADESILADENILAGYDSLPENVTLVKTPVFDADIYHLRSDSKLATELERRGLPWVATCHTDLAVHGLSRSMCRDNWIYVSKSLAQSYGSKRFIDNGIDPRELSYREKKGDYVLFVAALPLARRKGLELAIKYARGENIPLIVAGSSPDKALVKEITQLCDLPGVHYVGEISGRDKASLFAGARALLFPTQINEAFGLVLAEAMMSGTPVICSDNGACPDIVNAEVGFVCRNEQEYKKALRCVKQVSPQNCRKNALKKYHYKKMAKAYLREYLIEINS